jgi:hypothetical protein
MSLDCVLHNKPDGLNLKHIFDEILVEVNGRQVSGKYKLYFEDSDVILRQLAFEKSPPLTDLIRELFCLFRSLTTVAVCYSEGRSQSASDAANVHKLRDCKEIVTLMRSAIERRDWPEVCDKVGTGDCSPREAEVDEDHRPGCAAVPVTAVPVAVAHLSTITNTHRAPTRGSEEDKGDHATLVKYSGL